MSLYTASVPVFVRYLHNLSHLLALADQHVRKHAIPEIKLLNATLSDGMFSFAQQVNVACGFALRASYPLANLEIPHLPDGGDHLGTLQIRVAKTIEQLQALPADTMIGTTGHHIRSIAGFAELDLPAADYLFHYASPNFFFHLSMAYAILRQQGVEVSKQHFDGFHSYPSGFRFPIPTIEPTSDHG
ncbi:DUF1993 domain-containing protein [Chitinivorax sp. B]|uniref:DUF1993 family protein n=1 Tax=Chitinivorax sp. B TaxID=2502235 RepID=UPI0010F9F994|nr:DUF1993 domain-containing protein [Chitinivorax sp. B]